MHAEAAESKAWDYGDTVMGIISYVRWPGDPSRIRLCLIGTNEHEKVIARAIEKTRFKRVVVLDNRTLDQNMDDCNAVFLGNVSEDDWPILNSKIAEQPVLTISGQMERCIVGVMFCLDDKADSRSRFQVNLDAVARAGIRVNPQVLRLARPVKGGE